MIHPGLQCYVELKGTFPGFDTLFFHTTSHLLNISSTKAPACCPVFGFSCRLKENFPHADATSVSGLFTAPVSALSMFINATSLGPNLVHADICVSKTATALFRLDSVVSHSEKTWWVKWPTFAGGFDVFSPSPTLVLHNTFYMGPQVSHIQKEAFMAMLLSEYRQPFDCTTPASYYTIMHVRKDCPWTASSAAAALSSTWASATCSLVWSRKWSVER